MNRLRTAGELIAVTFCTVAFCATMTGLIASIVSPAVAGTCDFVEYWSSSKLLLQHANPYDGTLLLPIELSAYYPKGISPLIMGHPVWTMPLIAPLGLFSATPARLFWIGGSLVCLYGSVVALSRFYGPLKTPTRLLALTFAPVFACLIAGQITLFLLAGAILFLYFYGSRPFLAGAALWFCLLKPHLFIPVGCVLLIWIVMTSSYSVIAGAAASLGAATLFALYFDPGMFTHYRQMMAQERYDRLPVPCLSVMLRQFVWPHNIMIQCIPLVLGCIWAVLYFRRHREHWRWEERLPILLLVSVLAAPYTWLYDQVLVVPAIVYGLQSLPNLDSTWSRGLVAILAVSSGVVEVATLSGHALLHSFFYAWTVPFWLAWYIAATWTARRKNAMQPLVA